MKVFFGTKVKRIDFFLGLFFILIFIIYLSIFAVDCFKFKNCGLLNNIYYHRLFLRFFIFLALVILLRFFIYSNVKFLRKIGFQLNISLGFILILEFFAFIFFKINNLEAFQPTHFIWLNDPPLDFNIENTRQKFYGDINPYFGRWRESKSKYITVRCSDNKEIMYFSNSFGARDKERNRKGENRIAIVGDSFIEGTLVNCEERLTNILERETKFEHLNFGIIGANSVSYYKILKHLVNPNFEYEKLIIGILPGNDFDSGNIPLSGNFINYPIYRPYWKLIDGQDSIRYSLNSFKESIESFEVLKDLKILRQTRDSIYSKAPLFGKVRMEVETNSYLFNLVYYVSNERLKNNKTFPLVFEKPPLNSYYSYEFETSIRNILKLSGDKEILFVVFPLVSDIVSYKANRVNQFVPYLKQITEKSKVKIVSLLEPFSSYEGDYNELYISCDGHWNEKGNSFAAEVLLNHPIYKEFIAKN